MIWLMRFKRSFGRWAMLSALWLGVAAEGSPAQASATGRFQVIACSEGKRAKGVRKAEGIVRALRAAGFRKAHLIGSEQFPKLQSGLLVCLVDSLNDKGRAFDVAARAKNKGFSAYVAVGW